MLTESDAAIYAYVAGAPFGFAEITLYDLHATDPAYRVLCVQGAPPSAAEMHYVAMVSRAWPRPMGPVQS